MDRNWNEELLSFIAASPTAFHACRNLAERLTDEGYTELREQDAWTLQPGGRYFVRRNGSALIAFRIPQGGVRGFLMMAAHADSPSFKIKEHAAVPTAGMYTRLNVEKYGGMLCASWMDRPLSVAGRAAVREDGRIVMKLVNIQRDLLLIPHVAIHMDRSANDGKKFDPNTDMLPLFGDGEAAGDFDRLIAESLGVKQEDVLVKMLREGLPNLKTVIINSNREKTNVILGRKNRVIYGSGTISDVLCGLTFRISPFSFWQVNRAQAERLYEQARAYAALTGSETLLDLYCGTGTIGLTMAKNCKTLIGVEIVADAVHDAEQNAAVNTICNACFMCADAPQAAAQLEQEGIRPDVVVLDPPRKGCGEALVKTIAKMAPKRVVYVSCDPATLARDLRFFADAGYQTQEITPVDMFPRTAHVESVALVVKQ